MKHLMAVALILFTTAHVGSAQMLVEASGRLDESTSPIIRPVSGGALIDFDADGYIDIYREGLLQRQSPEGFFENVRVSAGIDDLNGRTEGGLWADHNGDGLPDVLIVNRLGAPRLFTNQGYGYFSRSDRQAGLDGLPAVVAAVWLDANADGRPDLAVATANNVQVLLRNATNGRFQLRSSVGVPGVCGLTAVDYDQDGDTDLYASVCQPGSTSDRFLANSGSATFSIDNSVIATTNTRISPGAVWLDYDRDGDLDVFVANGILEPPPSQLATAIDRMYRNNGDGTFSTDDNTGDLAGGTFDQAWGVAAADLDNDGWVDIYVSNRDSPDVAPRVQHLYRNLGNGQFRDVTGDWLGDINAGDRAVPILGDINQDGATDLYLAAADGDRLFLNRGPSGKWLRVQLQNQISGSDFVGNGLGARLVAWMGGSPQATLIASGQGHVNQSDGLTAHFGLGTAAQVDSLVIYWPGGSVERRYNLAANQFLVVQRGGASGRPPSPFTLNAPAEGTRFELSDGNILFSWGTSLGADDYQLTLWGPGIDTTISTGTATQLEFDPSGLIQQQAYTWTVTSSNPFGPRRAVERNTFGYGGSTVAAPIRITMALRNLSSGQMAFADYDGDGDLDLAMTGATALAGDARLFEAVDSLFPAGEVDQTFKLYRDTETILRKVQNGSVSWADYNGDGRPDLFLTGYFEDTDGSVSIVSDMYENEGVLRQNISVSQQIPDVHLGDAAWADFDGDGDLDLLLAGATSPQAPWNPITRLVRNNGGSFVSEDLGLEGAYAAHVSWVDFDTDGRLDAFVMGRDAQGVVQLWGYRNTGGGFTPMNLGVAGLDFGSMDWADYDADGDPDLLISGGVLSPELYSGRTKVYRNDGGTLTDIGADRDVAQLAFGDAVWIDFDNDGDQDILSTGATHPYGERTSFLYRNEDNLRFAEEFKLNGLLFASIGTGDYNGDGDTDMVILGLDPEGAPTTFFLLNMIRPEVIPAGLIPR